MFNKREEVRVNKCLSSSRSPNFHGNIYCQNWKNSGRGGILMNFLKIFYSKYFTWIAKFATVFVT